MFKINKISNNVYEIENFLTNEELNEVYKIIKTKQVTALCIGNFLNYKENSYQSYKEYLINLKT
jgi:hypothetical protein